MAPTYSELSHRINLSVSLRNRVTTDEQSESLLYTPYTQIRALGTIRGRKLGYNEILFWDGSARLCERGLRDLQTALISQASALDEFSLSAPSKSNHLFSTQCIMPSRSATFACLAAGSFGLLQRPLGQSRPEPLKLVAHRFQPSTSAYDEEWTTTTAQTSSDPFRL